MGYRLRYTTTIVVSIEVLAGAFLELVSALAKATPLVSDRILEMCLLTVRNSLPKTERSSSGGLHKDALGYARQSPQVSI